MEGQTIRLNRRGTRLIYWGVGLLLALGLLWTPKTVSVQSSPVPQVTLTAPAEALIGEDFTFTVKFKNASPNPGDIGYGPFIDLVLDAGGANITKPMPPCACDGITFVKAEMVGVVGGPVSLNSFPVLAPCSPTPPTVSLPHPFAASGIGPVAVPAGAQLITLELPFGSFDPTQPEIEVQVTAHVSNLADAGTPLKIFARGGFRYGTDPLDNPSTDPPILSDTTPSTQWTANAQTTPTVLTIKKEHLGPEDETATGPNFTGFYPLQYRITVDIANGQTVSNVTVTDCFPNNLAFQSVVSVNPATPTVTTPPAGVPNNPPNNCLTVTWPALTGASGPDAAVVVEFFIPEKDANGNPVLPPNCQPVQSVNDVKAEGDWTPTDPCDASPAHVVSDITSSDHILNDKCIAIQKKVTVFQDTGAPGPTPGDVLQYTLSFQISDFKTFGKLEVRDLLPDGQQFLPMPAPTLTVTDQFGTVSGPFIPFLDLSVTLDPHSTCQGIKGTTNLVFHVSLKMTGLFPSNPRHQAGILTGGWATMPTSFVPATGQIVFYARIQDQFSFPLNHPGDRFVDKDDPLANCVTIRGEVFTNVNPPQLPTPTGVTAQDDSETLTAIVTDFIKKTVYAVKRAGQEICGPNTSPCPAKPQVTPGDEVTFRIEKVIPSSDTENLAIQDWLPLPIFDVADPDANGMAGPAWSFINAACGIPTPGQACLGPTNSLAVGPSFAANSATNSLTFNYGTFNDPTNTPRKIDLLFTVTATNDPFADGLFLTNQAQECEENTFNMTFCQVAIAQVQMAEPKLRIIKGVVASDNPNAIFSPAAPPSGTFTPPGGSCPRFNGTINSSNIGSLNLNSNISGVDANDKVTFAIVVENQGSSPNGVFDVKIRDIFPLGPTDLPLCFVPDFSTLCVTDGTGAPIPFIVGPGGFGSVIIELTDPGPTTGALGPSHPTNGTNIAVITFDAMLLSDIKSGCCDNRARLENYSNTEGGPNFVAAGFGGPFEDTAQACVGPRPFAKCIQTTSEVHTIPQSASQGGTVDAAIGEIVRYRLITVIPEGTTPNFQIQDLLPPGLTYIGNPSVIFVADNPVMSPPSAFWPTSPNQALAQCPGPPFPISALNVAGGPFTPGLGVDPIFFVQSPTNPAPFFTIVNSDNDPNLEFAIIEFNALVDNIAGNQSSTTLPNQFQVRFTDEAGNPFASNSGAVNVHVVEPNLKLTKSVSPAAVVPGGPPVTYTVTIANTGAADAFDIVFTDTLPPGLTVVAGSLTLPAGCTGSATGQNVSVTCPQLDDGTAIQITYQATVSATVSCPTTLTNQATVTWTSLPGPNGTTSNPTGSSTPGASGAINGERNGSSAFPPSPPNSPDPPNKYHATASAALTVNCPQCASVSNEQVSCNPNGTFSYTATLTNLSSTVATGINIVPPSGVTITPSSITTPLSPGQSITGTVTISGPNAQPGATICFDIVLTGQGQVICQTKHCITLPPCPGGPCVQAPSGMVGWWPLDDAVGQSTVQDLAGGNNGTTKDPSGAPLNISLGAGPQVVSQLPASNILGGTLKPVVVDPAAPPPPPTPRGALFFNRSFAEVPHNANLNIGSNGITITLWAWAAATPVAITPLIEKFAGGNGYSLYLEVSGSTYVVKFNLNGTIVTGPPAPFGTTPTDWRFIVARVSPSGSVTLTVCDLGGSCTTSTPITVASFTTSNTVPLWFARSAVAFPGAVFTALELALDEVEIFNRALTPAELQTIYDAERQGTRKCPCVPPPADMVAWYPLDEQTGATTVNDIAPPPGSTVSDNGTPQPGPVTPVPPGGGPAPVAGKVGAGALYFYGPHVAVPHSADLTFTGDFSIDAWIRVVECGFGGGGVLAPIVDKWDPTTQTGFSLFVDQPSPSTGLLKLQINNALFTSGTSLPTGANPLANTGPWVHVAVTVNRTTGVGTFYINGAPAGTFTVPSGSITNILPMLIGEIRVPGGRCEIAIDELELFNRALTPKEVQDIFNADAAGKCKPQPGPPGRICVVKFEDLDGDGVQDPNEPLLPGWQFTVTDANNNPVGTITTSPPGTPVACLTVAAPGTYTVTEQVQPGWTPTTPNPQTVTVQPGQTVTVIFGNRRQQGQICVVKFEDLDGDGVQDPNEPLLPGWQFTVTDANNNPVGTITTSPPGTPPACLTVAAPGTYTVTEQVQPGWTPTTPNPQTVTVQPGQTVNLTFGNRGRAEICVFKFNDLDGDGVQDPNEPLLPGWQFTVTDANNNPVGTITTSPPGTPVACLTVAAPGTYTVTEQVQPGWTPTTPNPQTVTVQPGQTVTVIFGNRRQQGQICVVKFEDLDGDGVQDPNEPLLPGWQFTVTDANNNPVGTITTSPPGTPPACLTVAAPGTYTVTETVQSGWTPTTPTSQTVTVQPGQTANLTFGNQGKAEICIFKFNDLNGNGKQDPNEPGLPGWQFTVSPAPLPPTTSPVTTDPQGGICFGVSAPGTYTITEIVQSGWTATTPTTQTVNVTPGQLVNLTFGNKAQPGEICVVKFEDLDGDGVQDANEPLLAGWQFTVTDASGATVGTITTGTTQPTCLKSVAPGTYTVTETVQSGWTPTTPTSQTVTVSPATGSIVTFGNKKVTYQICGMKWNDLDGDGVKDPNEPGLPGWTINMVFQTPGGPLDVQTTTDANGQYCFTGLAPGTYTISETLQPGWIQTFPPAPGTYTVTVPPSVTNINFGNQQGVCDREIKKTITPNPAQSGQQVTITLTVTNVGTVACPVVAGINVADPQPTGLMFNTASPPTVNKPGWSCGFTGPGVIAFCTSTSPLLPGPANAVTITFTATVTAPPGSQIENCAEVTNVGDVNQANNKSCVTLQVTGCVTPPANMTAWWPLDETAGTTANDLAGVNNQGTHVNGPTPTPGKVAGALRFDGVDDHVRVPDHAELDVGTDNFTLDAWVRTTAQGVVVLVDKRSGPTPLGYSLFLANGRLGFQMANGVGSSTCTSAPTSGVACVNYVAPTTSPNVADGQWHHVAAVVDRANTTTGVRLYVDGVQVFSGAPLGAPPSGNPATPANLDNTSDLYMGVRTPAQGGGGFFRGDLDEVELIKRALTLQEVQALFQAGSAGKCKGCIEGMKWNDANGNGVINPGEPGLSGWTIQLSGPVNATTTTGAGGTYRFCGLPPGTYTVSEVLQFGWVRTFPPTPGTHTVTLALNQTASNINFGNRPIIVPSDLVVKNLRVLPPTIPRGGIAVVSFDIVNQGEGEAGPATHQVRLIIRRPGATDIDVLLATVATGTLAAGASQSFNVPVRIPTEVPTGPALIRVVADSGGTVSESNEENNTAEVQIIITGGP